jgi:hypothetical protein
MRLAASACFENGGTGVSPVKSGVAPDFVKGHPLLVIRRNQSQATSRNGFGRDARNHRPEACATHLILKTRPNNFPSSPARGWAKETSKPD